MEKQKKEIIRFNHDLFNLYFDNRPVYACVSGGIDSIAGYEFIIRKLKYHINMLHVNHKLIPQDDLVANHLKDKYFPVVREPESAKVVSDLVKKYGTEGACRAIRLDAIKSFKHPSIFIYFHHLNDCIESYLLNTFTGKNLHNPINCVTNIGIHTILRPFLLTKKSAFQNFIEANKLSDNVIEDELNNDITRKRNFVRKKVLPLLGDMFPLEKIVRKKVINHYSSIFSNDNL